MCEFVHKLQICKCLSKIIQKPLRDVLSFMEFSAKKKPLSEQVGEGHMLKSG